MQQDNNNNPLGQALEKLLKDLGFSSLNQLWDEAGLTSNRAAWYKRIDPRKPVRTSDKQIKKLIQGLEESGYVLSQEQEHALYAAVGIKMVRQEDKPGRILKLESIKDPDRQHLLETRLAGFISGTRRGEIAEIIKHINKMRSSGGYVAITGRAGEGKTALIAQLIASHFGRDKTACHIIPLKNDPGHQVTLLRSLMASLALRHPYLSDLWIDIFHRDTLAGSFAQMLREISNHGDQDVIFIDGLDQLTPDMLTDKRDVYFLPSKLPEGIVIVVSMRPDDLLKSLQLLSPLYHYELPKLSRNDFDLILAHYDIHLNRNVVDRLYNVAQENALYLHLITKELAQKHATKASEIISYVSHNPENIYSFSVERLKYPRSDWKEIIKPMLGLLLVTQEPLSLRSISRMLNVEDDLLRDTLRRLGGLIEIDGKERCYLYHLKFTEYLREGEQSSNKEYILLLNKISKVLGLADLVTQPLYKVRVLLQVARHLANQTIWEPETHQIFSQAIDIAEAIEDYNQHAEALREVVIALVDSQQLNRAEAVYSEIDRIAYGVEASYHKAKALNTLIKGLLKGQ